jgi:integrase
MTRYPKTGKGTRWTAKELMALQPKWAGDTLTDGEGLSGEIRVDGGDNVSVRWRYAYRWQNKVRWFQCGTFPDHSMADIRAKRDFAKEQVANGVSPVEKHQAQKIENRIAVEKVLIEEKLRQRLSLTVADLFDVWLADGVNRKDGNANLRRSFNKDVLPAIGQIPVKELSEHDLRKVYKDVLARGVQRTVVTLANDFGQMMRWAEERQPWRGLLIDGNPAKLVEIKKMVSHDYTEERDRVLSAEEIRELKDKLANMERDYEKSESKYAVERPLSMIAQCAVWLCLGTLCRIGELLMAEWRHVDLDTGEWFIPAENTKSHRGKNQDQTVFLSRFALAQFQKLKELSGNSRWVFPSRNNDGHVCVKSVSKQIGDRQTMLKDRKDLVNRVNSNSLVLSGGKNGSWTPHDLRRTGATMMQALAVPLEIIDRCQNHILAGSKVRRHYMKYEYAKEKREAWAKLGERIEQILSTKNLVELRGAA